MIQRCSGSASRSRQWSSSLLRRRTVQRKRRRRRRRRMSTSWLGWTSRRDDAQTCLYIRQARATCTRRTQPCVFRRAHSNKNPGLSSAVGVSVKATRLEAGMTRQFLIADACQALESRRAAVEARFHSTARWAYLRRCGLDSSASV
ncbi:hypothetical protein EXIGLDRAFT_210211 [Exidia glandulosa HHB12029]|uniref:Uncharacterized protein n=1 Tax=Exidia glandulosa HHB12029 TaxID=1314781 RepID=A0A165ZZH3_EXIGL|nr:hypothetical protein EXIGLDRAFT_210211 [Exidia glandulosa HHB12029]